MLGKLVMLLLFTGSFGVLEKKSYKKIKVHCIFSKYLLGFVKLNEKYLLSLKCCQTEKETFTSKDLMAYGDNLQSHGKVIMAMLDKMRQEQPDVFHVDLMTINLYLNNIYGNLYLHSSVIGENSTNQSMDVNGALRKQYLKYYVMVHQYLTAFLTPNCQQRWIANCPIPASVDLIKYLTVDQQFFATTTHPRALLSKLNSLKTAASNVILMTTLEKNDYMDFDPVNMLFCSLLSGYETQSWLGNHSMQLISFTTKNLKEDDGLSLMRLVKVNEEYAPLDGYNIMDLYICVEFNFRADFVKSFQQQVLAATIHPVLSCASRYFTTIEYVYDNCKEDLYHLRITQIGKALVGVLNEIQNFDIFPSQVNIYLQRLVTKTTEIFNYPDKKKIKFLKPNWIKNLLEFCSKPMELNGLVFDANAKISQSLQGCIAAAVMDQTEEQLKEVKNYLKALSNKLDVFKIIKRTVPHDEMFVIKPLNVFNDCADDIWVIDEFTRSNITNKPSQTYKPEASVNMPDPGADITSEEKASYENEG